MAKSGYKDVNVTNDGYIKIRYSWSAGTQNIANNFTPVNWSLQLISTNSSANISSSASKNYSVVTDGTTSSGTNTVGITGGSTKILASGSKNIYHNSDGSKTFNFSFSQAFNITYSGVQIGTITGSGTGTLDIIPRNSVLGTISNFTIGNAITIPITKYNESFSDTLNIYIGDTWIKRVEGLTNNQSVSFTNAELNNIYAAMPNVTNATFRFINSTYYGANVIGTSTKTSTGTINSNIKPSISNISLSENVSGIATKFGAYIQNKSKISGTITASAGTGSSIDKYNISINGVTYTSSTFITDLLTTSGSNTCSVTVTDKRGRAATSSITFNVVAYENPKVTSLSVVRCNSDGTLNDNGNYAKINGASLITSISNNNDKIFKLEYKLKSASSWTTNQTYTGGYTYTITNRIISGISADYEYDFRITATDYFSTQTKEYALSSGFTIIDVKGNGKGIAFGKVSTKDAMEIGLDMYDKFDTKIGNGVSILRPNGTEVDPNTTLETLVLTNVNTPITSTHFYIYTIFTSVKNTTSARSQIAVSYVYNSNQINRHNSLYTRYYIPANSTWSDWRRVGAYSGTWTDSGDSYIGDSWYIRYGKVNITPTANTPTTQRFNFGVTFATPPIVLPVASTGVIGKEVLGVSVNTITTTYVDIVLTRTNSTPTGVHFLVTGKVV